MDDTNQQIQNSQPASEVIHGYSSKTNLIFIGLGVLFVLGLGGAYVLGTRNSQLGQVETTVTPTVSQRKVADSTVEWKTFTKTEDGYSIQYPDSLRYVGNSGGIGPSDEWESKDRRYNISVQLFSAKDYPSSFNLPKDIIKSDETITISGQSVRKVTKEIPTGLTIDIGPIKHNNSAYFLHYFGTKGEESSGISIFNQMVSTFKFTDQGQAGNTADWKKYTDTKYGFSFRYPPGSTFPKYQYEDTYSHPDYLKSVVIDFPVESFAAKHFVSISIWGDLSMPLATVQQFKDYCEKLLSHSPEGEISNPICSSESSYESIMLNGHKAYKIKGGQDNTLIELYFIPFNSYVYEIRIPISVLYDEKNSYKIEKVSRAILSSFKFIQ